MEALVGKTIKSVMGSKAAVLVGIIVLVGASYHLVRDVLQIIGVQNIFTGVAHWEHEWCKGYCDYVTLPIEIFTMVGSVIIIRRKKFGVLGVGVAIALLMGLFMWLWQ